MGFFFLTKIEIIAGLLLHMTCFIFSFIGFIWFCEKRGSGPSIAELNKEFKIILVRDLIISVVLIVQTQIQANVFSI